MATSIASGKKKSPRKTTDIKGYDRFKNFNGEFYKGMPVGRTHTWHYDRGDWKEKKITPDRWEISYAVTKRRVGKAPEGSGVPVGTGYHWFILSHQFVHKLNADDYTTTMTGIKLKLAHRSAGKKTWNASAAKQTEALVTALEELIRQIRNNPLVMQPVPLNFVFNNKTYEGMAVPAIDSCEKGFCTALNVTLNNKHTGMIHLTKNGWRLPRPTPQKLASEIGRQIEQWYNDNQ